MSSFLEEDELYTIIEDTFDTCSDNREEIYWLITIIRGMMNIPNERRDYSIDNANLNLWQYQLHPILEKYKKHWHHSNY